MKRLFVLVLSTALIFSLAACGNGQKDGASVSDSQSQTTSENGQSAQNTEGNITSVEEDRDGGNGTDSKILIVYFTAAENSGVDAVSSASYSTVKGTAVGRVRALADMIQNETGGDLFSIQTSVVYPADGRELIDYAAEEQDDDARPELTSHIENLDQYDTFFIGYPIWWGTTPRVVNTFLEKYDLAGKTVIPFCTSGGSDIDGSLPDLKKSCEGATFKEGYTADTGSMAEIRKWLTQIGEFGNTAENSKPPKTPEPTPTPLPSGNGKILVAYFSWSGTSERIAQNIIAQTGADSFRIERETPYSTDYTETAYGDTKTEADNNARPPIKNPLASVAQYDKIILCYPIWWHTAPMTVGTFLESYDLSGKHIYPVSQSASMDRTQYNQSVSFIKECAKGAAVDEGIFSKNNTDISTYIENTVLK